MRLFKRFKQPTPVKYQVIRNVAILIIGLFLGDKANGNEKLVGDIVSNIVLAISSVVAFIAQLQTKPEEKNEK